MGRRHKGGDDVFYDAPSGPSGHLPRKRGRKHEIIISSPVVTGRGARAARGEGES